MSTTIDREAMSRAIETGDGLQSGDLAVAHLIMTSGVSRTERENAIAFCLAAERLGAFAAMEASLAALIEAGAGERETLLRVLAGLRAARESLR